MAIIVGFTSDNPLLQGTALADEIYGNRFGNIGFVAGNDRIFGLAGDDLISGDGIDILAAGRGGNDLVRGGDGTDRLYGDASGTLYGVGGDDVIYQDSLDGSGAEMRGDAETMATGSRGGNDKLYGGGELVGDAYDDMTDVICGHDLLSARSSSVASDLTGDSWNYLYGSTVGGNDRLDGSSFDDGLAGESFHDLADVSRGGNDKLWGHGGDDRLYGDASSLDDASVGGNDVLRGGTGNDTLYGDAPDLYLFSTGGDDRLHGDAGDDELWGDGLLDGPDATGGKDKFFFSGDFGDDTIFDFRPEDGDQIVLQGLTQLDVQLSIISLTDPNDSTLITTLGDDSITLVGFTGGLTPGVDIIFA